ncbi:MAG: hypothetical protein ABIA02_01340 [Candidatus Falkowbacteria bacterium]
MIKLKLNQRGTMLMVALLATSIFLALMGGLASVGVYQQKLYRQQTAKHQALHVAEAGINYYRWLLAHDHEDFYDGTGVDPGPAGEPYGPYTHTYTAPSSGIQGTYSLEITPPITGSTIVGIKSTGWMNDYPNLKRTIDVRYGIPSFAIYNVAVNSNVRFGPDTEVFGPLHSNGGIRFDGVAHNIVTSGVNCYDDPDTAYSDACERPGVWTNEADESTVFLVGYNFPVPVIDFNSVTADLAQIKADAQADGMYLAYDNRGYRIHFNADGTFDVYDVNQLMPNGQICEESGCAWPSAWKNTSYDIQTEVLLSANNPMPNNGLIFVEANAWVDGIVNGRVTVASGRFPENPNNYTNITIVNDIVYNSNDGSDVLGLIAQRNVQIGYYSEDDLEIHAAILAQHGKFHRPYYYYYEWTHSHNDRTTITVYGAMAMNERYGLHWCCPSSGYTTRNINYDSNLIYGPPPSYPTTGEYAFISWEEE